MKILVANDINGMAKAAAALVAARIAAAPELRVAWCTGRTVVPVYAELVRLHQEEGLRFDRIHAFDLDEYEGLPAQHPATFRQFLMTRLLGPAGADPARIRLLDGSRTDWQQEATEYEEHIRSLGGIDLLLEGIGANGHLAFNEPGSPFGSETRLVELKEESRKGQLPFFASLDEVPHQAITRGIRSMMRARSMLLMASGASKASPLQRALLGPITEAMPASVLQLHPDVTMVLDRAAAEHLLTDPRTARDVVAV